MRLRGKRGKDEVRKLVGCHDPVVFGLVLGVPAHIHDESLMLSGFFEAFGQRKYDFFFNTFVLNDRLAAPFF